MMEPAPIATPITVAAIQASVCARYGIRPLEMVSHRRSKEVVRPRHIAMYLAREMTASSLPQIGRMFGGRDHTTVMHAVQKIEAERKTDLGLAEAVLSLRHEVEGIAL